MCTCEIWGTTKETPEIEGFQLQYLKYMLGVKNADEYCSRLCRDWAFPLSVKTKLTDVEILVKDQ